MRANDPQRCETASTSSLLYFKVWKIFALSMVVFALVVGLLVGIGWMFDLPALTRIMPGFTTMKPNTSVGVIFSALALGALLINLEPFNTVAKFLAGLVLLLGIVTSAQFILSVDFGIDEWMVRVPQAEAFSPHPARMSPVTAFCFVFIGFGLVLLDGRKTWMRVLSEVSTTLALLAALIGLAGSAYGVTVFYRIGEFESLPVHAGLVFLALSLGILAARPRRGLVSLLIRDTSGSLLARRLLPAALTVPLLLGWLRVKGQEMGYYELAFGTAMLVSAQMVIFVGLIWRTAASLDRSDLERRSTADALRESERRYRSLFESIDEGFCVIEVLFDDRRVPVDCRFLEVNPSFEKQIGLKHPVGKTIRSLMPAENPHWFERCGQVALTGEGAGFEEYIQPMGRWFDVRASSVGCLKERKVALLFNDISERKRVEAALRESLRELRDFQTALDQHAIVAITDPRGKIVLVNDKFCMISKFSREELIGQDHRIINSGHHSKAFIADLWNTIKRGDVWRGEMKNRAKDGSYYWVDTTIVPFFDEQGKVRQYVAIRADISERKRVEEALQENKVELEFILEAAQVGDWNLDLIGDTTRRSLRHDKVFGYPEGAPDWGYAIFLRHVHPEDRARVDHQFREVLAAHNIKWHFECRVIWPDGMIHWIEVHGSIFRSPDGVAERMLGVVLNITERKQAEEEIRMLNQELESRVIARTSELREAVKALKLEIQARLRLEREILEISEREQCRLGQDLHDGLGQELAGISLLSKALADELQLCGHPSAKVAANIANYSRGTIESARQLAKGLYPVELSRNGLLFALEDLACQTRQRYGVSCTLHEFGPPPKLDRSAEIHIYRIVQECIGNAIKHGKAPGIRIESLAGDHFHEFSITDNGIGCDGKAAAGMGLHIMQYRARVIGGRIEVGQSSGGGCRVSCWLPA